ncbi:hypothetical protein ACLQ18_43220 [Streptomyces sp. DT193]|uniref:hypothetical protein n=1 Tax=Streptomyces sp. DT193 TaxID=3393418 RepID=UPI003CF61D06
MVYAPNPPSQPPALIEALAVYGWAVAHGGLPLAYAADILAEHTCYGPEHTGVPDATPPSGAHGPPRT